MKRLTAKTSKSPLQILQQHLEGTHQPALQFCINVPPVPASRPRVSRWGTYYSATYKNWMKAVDADLSGVSGVAYEGEVMAIIEHIVARPKTTKREWPRGDADNYAKATLDALTKRQLGWLDDDQVVALVSLKRFAQPGEVPHILVWVYPII